jgi:cellobiose phosphorylase
LKQLSGLASVIGKNDDSVLFVQRAEVMTAVVNDKCWDGQWYVRGFGKEAIGTHKSDHAKIILNSQVWAVMSGAAAPERAVQCMDSVRKYLASDEGVKNIWPVFEKYDQTYGLISRYNKGRKENGIFAHTNAWAIIAETMIGRPGVAFEYYKNILSMKYNDKAEILKTEPYIFCQTICSDDSINKGEGANSWLTGTASWMYVAATQYILGIKPVLSGLCLDPRIPESWTGFKVKRMFRGCTFNIEVRRGSEKRITVDGALITGNVVPPQNTKQVDVVVEIKGG